MDFADDLLYGFPGFLVLAFLAKLKRLSRDAQTLIERVDLGSAILVFTYQGRPVCLATLRDNVDPLLRISPFMETIITLELTNQELTKRIALAFENLFCRLNCVGFIFRHIESYLFITHRETPVYFLWSGAVLSFALFWLVVVYVYTYTYTRLDR